MTVAPDRWRRLAGHGTSDGSGAESRHAGEAMERQRVLGELAELMRGNPFFAQPG